MVFTFIRPRFTFLLTGAALALAGSTFADSAPTSPSPDQTFAKAPAAATLKDTFKPAFLMGVALNARQFEGSDAEATALISREFNCATAENVMKWEVVEPENNRFEFKQADEFVDFCRQHGLTVIGHNLCWHSQLPSWVSKPDAGVEKLDREVLLARLKNHITTVAAHFKGKVHGWDVVNEAISDKPGEYRPSVFFRLIGQEYLALAFKWAHEADPDAELYYNDYNLDADDAKRAKAIELVKYLREQGARIDGIGLQGHYNLTTPTAKKIEETIRMFADLGLKVMITELDVIDVGAPTDVTARDQAVAAYYKAYLDVVLANPSCRTVVTWGLSDHDSWITHYSMDDFRRPDGQPPRPLPFDAELKPKPAYFAIADAFRGAPTR